MSQPILLDGKRTSLEIQSELAARVAEIRKSGRRVPHLAAVLVGNDGASETYVGSKVRTCEKTGFRSTLIRLPADTGEGDLLKRISVLNSDPGLDGFIVQLPLPGHIDERKIIEAIDPAKDVDGFHPMNAGKMMLGLPCFVPATPLGILQLLERYKVPTEGRHCVVIGRSRIVGSPMSVLMARNARPGNCTVTVTHSRTRDLAGICRSADIIIAALGKPGFLKADMVKKSAVVIDVGITRVDAPGTKSGFRLKGDVDFENVAPKCSFITPVPGGVGPMTIAALLLNTMQAWQEKSAQVKA